MAKTLIGQLILRLRTEGLGEAKKVTEAMRSVENAARRLGSAGTGTWGVGFQRQLDKLKLAPDEIRRVEQSWIALHDSMRNRNLAKALRSSELGHWKTNTISVLAQGRAEMDRHFTMAERAAKGHAMRMRDALKLGLVPLGAYSLPYFGGMLGAEAITASAERRREIFRQRMANIPEGERESILNRSEELGQQYPSVPVTAIMELARTARNTMGTTERGLEVLESAVKGLVVLQSTSNPQAAGNVLDGLLRGIDNLGQNKEGDIGIDQTKSIIDGIIRAAQIEGIQLNPGDLFNFARRSKIAGPALSTEFLITSAPAIMQDMKPETAGAALSSAYQAFVIGSNAVASKANIAAQQRLGLRTGPGKGELVGSEMFGQNPYEWVKTYLMPALDKAGVDRTDETAVNKAIAELTRNTHASGLLSRMVTQSEQIDRIVGLYRGAMGTDKADEVRVNDPFVGWQAFKSALQNLSTALTPIDHINAGINGLADGINALAAAAKDNPALAWAGLAGGTAGTVMGGKWAASKMADLFGLRSSALALDGSAAALTRAAVALGGSAVTDGDLPGKPGKSGGFWSLLATGARTVGSMAGFGLGVAALGDTPGSTIEDQVKYQRQYREFLEKVFGMNQPPPQRAPGGPSFREAENASMLKYRQDESAINDMLAEARAVGQEIENSLSVTAKPTVDNSALQQTLGLIRAINSELRGVAAGMSQAKGKVGAEMRRNFADGGVGGW